MSEPHFNTSPSAQKDVVRTQISDVIEKATAAGLLVEANWDLETGNVDFGFLFDRRIRRPNRLQLLLPPGTEATPSPFDTGIDPETGRVYLDYTGSLSNSTFHDVLDMAIGLNPKPQD